jgi:hypothetical protein
MQTVLNPQKMARLVDRGKAGTEVDGRLWAYGVPYVYDAYNDVYVADRTPMHALLGAPTDPDLPRLRVAQHVAWWMGVAGGNSSWLVAAVPLDWERRRREHMLHPELPYYNYWPRRLVLLVLVVLGLMWCTQYPPP